ncbi:carboxy-S-adenosyl-L-methionine synthase CmoA [Vibrio tubiashii]|uniref:carboxy-S-adenosyl-L-methionine synthase CmoA n=1 Tax=Vibrio tubiashii TaxID=29498 RepID=UPI001EFEE902|nr:carboxy-S-adenosyl-L-methionine synthase CmoA [Vibrio tubiashii]MCG9578811.1 carboxy-S-adenosyl-L-methionine synthase CmoA [Vibrio tubiashii]
MLTTKDKLFTRDDVTSFTFDEQVSACFDDMIFRSIPSYQTVQEFIIKQIARHPQFPARIYDIGCSTGSLLEALISYLPTEQISQTHLVGVDASQPMIDRAQAKLIGTHAQLVCAPANDIEYEPSDIIILNYVLQFLPRKQRDALLATLYRSLKPGGLLFLSEKISCSAHTTELYYDFKRDNGYSEKEISNKRQALNNVLVEDSLATHQDRLTTLGFEDVTVWLTHFNFSSIIARKPL